MSAIEKLALRLENAPSMPKASLKFLHQAGVGRVITTSEAVSSILCDIWNGRRDIASLMRLGMGALEDRKRAEAYAAMLRQLRAAGTAFDAEISEVLGDGK